MKLAGNTLNAVAFAIGALTIGSSIPFAIGGTRTEQKCTDANACLGTATCDGPVCCRSVWRSPGGWRSKVCECPTVACDGKDHNGSRCE